MEQCAVCDGNIPGVVVRGEDGHAICDRCLLDVRRTLKRGGPEKADPVLERIDATLGLLVSDKPSIYNIGVLDERGRTIAALVEARAHHVEAMRGGH